MTPRYEHDCPACTFVGIYKEYDLWVCVDSPASHSSLIARTSDEPPDYSSYPAKLFTQVLYERLMKKEEIPEHMIATGVCLIQAITQEVLPSDLSLA